MMRRQQAPAKRPCLRERLADSSPIRSPMTTESKSNPPAPDAASESWDSGAGASVFTKKIKTLTSAQTAQLLGISTSSAQKLMDLNVLEGWRTGKGHRRFIEDSVLAYISQARNHMKNGPTGTQGTSVPIRILAILENENNRDDFEKLFKKFNLNIQVTWVESTSIGLVELAAGKYQIFLVQKPLTQTESEGFIAALLAYCKNHLLHPLSILCHNPWPAHDHHTSLDWGFATVHFLEAPLEPRWLQAYLTGIHDKEKIFANSKIT